MPDILPGQAFPLGATVTDQGVNFALFSKNCQGVDLLLYDGVEDARPTRVISLDPRRNRTFYYWHVLVPGLTQGQLYAYRVQGPHAPHMGFRFDNTKVLLDPYAREVTRLEHYSREAASRPGDNAATSLRGVVVNPSAYDWEGDAPLQRSNAHTLIYELHVRGFTRHPSSGVEPRARGTYRGLIQKIPYLQQLGITAVELMPVQQFDPQQTINDLPNYWGYNPMALFAPHAGYCSSRDRLAPVNEFRDMVKALHRAGIEVLLDVVFNHTAEGGIEGPTLSFRGLENRAYYILGRDRLEDYEDYTGCGNTFNTNHSIVRRTIMDCLRHWVSDMHVDGFRFDLASVMSRDEFGEPLLSPPILWDIESDPVLAGAKIIAEAWDAAGLYQVGRFIGDRWAEWNGSCRDDMRRFVRGDDSTVQQLAARLCASPDLYHQEGRDPNRSINFVTCHDGFTLNDLVSYNTKHNEANGQDNRDGTDADYSWNCGIEGPTEDPEVESLRLRQVKNLFSTLLLSQGTPMLCMGDEVRRTQQGNNNAYCLDNEVSWFDWNLVETNADLLDYVRRLIAFTQKFAVFNEEAFWSATGRIEWHGVHLGQPDWSDTSHSLAFTLHAEQDIHVMLNAWREPLWFELPGPAWHGVFDTSKGAADQPAVEGDTCRVEAWSIVIAVR